MTQDTWAVPLPPPDNPARVKERGGAGLFHSTQAHSLVPWLSLRWAENNRLLSKAIKVREPRFTDGLP